MLARERAETRARLLVGPKGALVVVLRIGRDLLGDRAHLGGERGAVLGVAHQGLDPALGSVVLGHVVLEEQTTEDSLRSVASGTLSASRAPPKAAPTEASPMTRAPRHRTLPYRCWRQTPTMTVGMMASSEVASACSWVRPSHVSVGTKRIPPPTPNSPERTPATSPSRTART